MLRNRGPNRPYSTVALSAVRGGGIHLTAVSRGGDESSLSDSSLSDSGQSDKDKGDKSDSDIDNSQVEVPSDAALSDDELQAGADGEGEGESGAEGDEGESGAEGNEGDSDKAMPDEARPLILHMEAAAVPRRG